MSQPEHEIHAFVESHPELSRSVARRLAVQTAGMPAERVEEIVKANALPRHDSADATD